MQPLPFILPIVSLLPWCAQAAGSEGSLRADSPATLIVDRTASSSASPYFRSIQQAVDQAKTGDTILVKEGTYHETVTVRKEGITIAAFDPLRPPVLDGADPALGRPTWEHVQDKVYRTDYSWYKPQLKPREFNRYGGGESADHIALQVYEDGVLLRGYVGGFIDYGTSGYGAPYSDINQLDPMSPMFYPRRWYKQEIRIPGRFLYDERDAKLYVWSAAGDDPGNHLYSIPVLERLIVLQARTVTLRQLVFTNAAGYAVVVGDGAHGARIEDCCFLNDMYAIYVERADQVRIARNFIQQKGLWERYWYYDCKGTVLWAHAIALEHYTDGITRHAEIEGNVVHGYYAAILANGSVTIHDNLLSHCLSTHINIDDDCPEIRIYRNVCHHVDDTSIGPGTESGPIWVYRNLFYHCGSLNKAGSDTLDLSKKTCYFYHNTFVLSDLISNHPYDYPVFGRHIYRNNIFHLQYLEPGNELYWRYADKNPSRGWAFFPFANGPDADYNLYWIGPRGPSRYIAFFSYAGAAAGSYLYDDFTRVQQEIGLDPHGMQVDPLLRGILLLEDASRSTGPYDTLSLLDYRDVIKAGLAPLLKSQVQRFWKVFAVAPGSPAVDRGTRLPAEWVDVVPIRDGKPDIGASELGSTDASGWGLP